MADVTVADIEAARGAARYQPGQGRPDNGGSRGRGLHRRAFCPSGSEVGFIDRDRGAAEALLGTLRGLVAPLFVACDLTDIDAAGKAARQDRGFAQADPRAGQQRGARRPAHLARSRPNTGTTGST